MIEEDNEGVAYLQALRQSAGATTPAAAAPARGPAPQDPSLERRNAVGAAGGQIPGKRAEQRRSPRYKCEGSAELREEGRDLRTWATFTDISMHGCYVEASASYAVGTVLNMKLELNGIPVRARGIVRVSYPALGMGIAFTEMSNGDRTRLRELVTTVSQHSVIVGSGVAPSLVRPHPSESAPRITDAIAAIRAIMKFFEGRRVMTQPEFLQLLHKSQETKD